MTDPIADMLTRIRNANAIRREKVDIPFSGIKSNIAAILKEEGFIRDFTAFGEGKLKTLRVFLKYGPKQEFLINRITRVSKPGCRRYTSIADLEPVVDGIGTAVISTSKGVLSDRKARKLNVGGEILFTVY
jgi:small subunit ribosomal protein S8